MHKHVFLPALFFCLFSSIALGQGAAAPVAVATAVETDLAQVVKLTGTVTARRDAQLSVATAGLVTTLDVDAGDEVGAGQALLELDAELARHQLASAQAVETQARRALADAKRRLEEAKRLAPQQSIAETVVKDLAAEVSEDEAALARASAEVGYRQGILERHRLIAPYAGVISNREIELGEWVTPGQAVLGLVSTEQLRLDFQVPEDYLGRVVAGSEVSFTFGPDRQERFPGRIIASVPITDPTVRTFLVRVEPVAPVPGLLPGMSAQADIRLDAGRRGIAVPRDAVLRYADGRTVVWIVEEREGALTAAERRVATGVNFGGLVEIQQGLSVGARVVVEGNESLRNGQALRLRAPAGS